MLNRLILAINTIIFSTTLLLLFAVFMFQAGAVSAQQKDQTRAEACRTIAQELAYIDEQTKKHGLQGEVRHVVHDDDPKYEILYIVPVDKPDRKRAFLVLFYDGCRQINPITGSPWATLIYENNERAKYYLDKSKVIWSNTIPVYKADYF